MCLDQGAASTEENAVCVRFWRRLSFILVGTRHVNNYMPLACRLFQDDHKTVCNNVGSFAREE